MPPRLAPLPRDDDHLPRRRGLPGRTATSTSPAAIDPDALERAHGFALDLVRLLDRDVGRAARAVI